MEVFESPCFNTRIFLNLCVLKHGDSKISVFYTRRFLNFCVLKHIDWQLGTVLPYKSSVFQYIEIKKSPCIKHRNFESSCFNTRRFKNIRVLNHGDKKNSVFYTSRFFFKRPITRWNRNRWWKYFRVWIKGLGTTNLWKKQSSKISCYCPFNEIGYGMQILNSPSNTHVKLDTVKSLNYITLKFNRKLHRASY